MKKLLAVLLSIMMLAMPLTSMAENSVWDNAARQETTITIHDLNADLVAALGGDDTAMAAINDLLAALSLTGYQQGDEAGFDLNLSGKSVLGMASLTTAAEENQLMYVSSALLGGVIAVNSKDVEAIKEKALRATMKMSGQSDEEIDKAIEESKEQLSGNAEYTALMEASANLGSMTEEQLMEELTQADTTAFMTMMNEILSGAEMAEVTEQPGDCDAAKNYVKVTVPPEKIAEMTKALLEMIHSVPSIGTDSSVVDVEIKETVDGVEQGFGVVVTTATTMDGEQGVRKVDVLVRFMGLDVVTITAETRTCDAKDALDVSKAQDLGAMTDSEFQTWFVKVMNNLQNLPMTLLMSLPESMLTLLMGGSN